MLDVLEKKKAIKNKEVNFNPFPGLRPFAIDESHLFFGREGQSDEVVEMLARNKFTAVIGASGSGKSSLMYCGIIPVLYGGFISNTGSSWHTIVTRPGSGPIDNLSEAIVQSLQEDDENEVNLKKHITSTVLRSSSLGLVEAIRQIKRPKNENILLVVDQFEELFRFKKNNKDIKSEDEALAFIKLLVNAINQSELPIYIIITMRSDFIGDCAQFPELTSKINKSHYLVPQMTRQDLRDAIAGPVAVGGGEMSSRLVEELLNSVGDNPDQLPILQHSLMRTWNYWVEHRSGNEVMDLKHYEAIGRMEQALSLHANEAFDELDQDKKFLCERIFKSLTEKGADNRGIRHPSTATELMKISGASLAELTLIVDKFRADGRSFITPEISKEITENTLFDISHESLMRVWSRLNSWVEDEASAIQMYLRLSEAAALYQVGKSGLWRPPDLQLALNWKDKHQPSLAWAERFDPAFERAEVFLESSAKEFEEEEKNKLRHQKRTLKRTRLFAIVLGVFTVFSFGLMLWAFTQKQEADKQKMLADKNAALADEKSLIAENAKKEALLDKAAAELAKSDALAQKQEALIAKESALAAKEEAEEAKRNAEYQRRLAVNALAVTEIEKNKAKAAQKKAETQERIARLAKKEADSERKNAEEAKKDALNLRMLSIANAMAVKSQQINRDINKRGLIALQAHDFNKEFGGNEYNPDVYNGLYYALKMLNEEEYNSLKGHTEAIRSVQYGGDKLYSAGSDGNVIRWDDQEPIVLFETDDVFRSMKINQDQTSLAVSTDGSIVYVIDLKDEKKKPVKLDAHRGIVWDLVFEDDALYSLGRDGKIIKWDVNTGEQLKVIKTEEKIRAISINSSSIVGASLSGSIFLWNKEGENKSVLTIDHDSYYSVQFSHDEKYIVAGDKNGYVKVWDAESKDLITVLEGQNARINALGFSDDDKMLAAASSDKSVQVWRTDKLNDQPMALRDHEWWVFDIAFSPDSKNLISGCSDHLIRKWPLNTQEMADQVHDRMNRNLSKKEWHRYVADDISYEKTVELLPQGDGVKKVEE
jgi:WD40 repeat protein/energy-coupling factor transporter ATP-binding protein EcfA2